jgi:hypothetical protein
MQLCYPASHKQEPSVFHNMERPPPLSILWHKKDGTCRIAPMYVLNASGPYILYHGTGLWTASSARFGLTELDRAWCSGVRTRYTAAATMPPAEKSENLVGGYYCRYLPSYCSTQGSVFPSLMCLCEANANLHLLRCSRFLQPARLQSLRVFLFVAAVRNFFIIKYRHSLLCF